MTDFAKLMERHNNLSNISDQLEKLTSGGHRQDDLEVWKLESDKAGNGEALIRFLPAPMGETAPTVVMYNHFFQGPGGWYVENSLSTIGKDDPLGEYNRDLWNTGIKANRDFVSHNTKRRTNFYANILVIDDPANPENNGQVKLFRFGKSIMDMLKEAMNPTFGGDEKINPFDLLDNGADFRIRVYLKDDYPNYGKSLFVNHGRLTIDGNEVSDEKLMEIWKSCQSLTEIISPDKFKTYDELKARMTKVLKLDGGSSPVSQKSFEDEIKDLDDELPDFDSNESSDDDDDDDLDFFKRLANG